MESRLYLLRSDRGVTADSSRTSICTRWEFSKRPRAASNRGHSIFLSLFGQPDSMKWHRAQLPATSNCTRSLIIVRRAPRFQPLMFTGALDGCLISQTDGRYCGVGFPHLQFSIWVSPRRGIEPTPSLQRKLHCKKRFGS